ncbi:prepilin-type N-terminal cleavage/methylation domain-containing protein [Clostridium ganghwense]|uniref:Prepilin-type N-terminal cleavage/methylation domain-containing protein n=2 Tax=Clostridium ganghwense TaxID=312089 RepID=A0ABT4CPD5_9CLOT|nr:prepilin-type N-terminal cleavage/methylation domain-containing protein [Clostridium ganghwense]
MIARVGDLNIKVKKKGFTLIEVLIVISILGIVMIPLSNFFFTNYKALNEVSKQVDLQSEGEKAIKKIVDFAIGSKGILEVKKGAEDLSRKTNGGNIDRIVFKTVDDSGSDLYEIFEVADNKLWHGTSGDSNKIIDKDGSLSANEVSGMVIAENIQVVNLGASESFINADGVKLIIVLSKDKVTSSVESEVYFRNK